MTASIVWAAMLCGVDPLLMMLIATLWLLLLRPAMAEKSSLSEPCTKSAIVSNAPFFGFESSTPR